MPTFINITLYKNGMGKVKLKFLSKGTYQFFAALLSKFYIFTFVKSTQNFSIKVILTCVGRCQACCSAPNLIWLPTQPITLEVMKCHIVALVITGLIPVTLVCRAKQGTFKATASPQLHWEGFIRLLTKGATWKQYLQYQEKKLHTLYIYMHVCSF